MKKMINTTRIEGILYEHNLELKVSGPNSKNPGTEFISGTVSIATDDACVNIVPVHFTYVTATTATGKVNNTFTVLNNIVNGTITTMMDGDKDTAGKLSIDSAIALNEFYTDRNGTEELVSAKRNEGGFVHRIDALSEDETLRNTFSCDMVITNCRRVEGDPEKNTADKVIVKGAIFNFRNSLLPVEFTAINPGAMNYFESLGASQKEPVFTKVWGRQVSETITRTITEESAFGDASVREVKSSRKDWVITGAAKELYEWDVEGVITAAELNEAITKREVDLAAMKARQDEYKASQSNPATPAAGAFNF